MQKEISSHTRRNDYYQKDKRQGVLGRVTPVTGEGEGQYRAGKVSVVLPSRQL